MPAPTTCEIASPTDGTTVSAGPSGTATITVTVTTDPTTPVELFDGASSIGTTTSNGDGVATFADESLTIGGHTLKAVAGTDPDITESDEVAVVVNDVIDDITTAESRSVRWYINFLAGNSVSATPESALPSLRQAACQWAGVSPQQYGSIGALNIKAGITDPYLFVSQNAALNFIAYSSNNRDDCIPWLTDQQALFKICQEA